MSDLRKTHADKTVLRDSGNEGVVRVWRRRLDGVPAGEMAAEKAWGSGSGLVTPEKQGQPGWREVTSPNQA